MKKYWKPIVLGFYFLPLLVIPAFSYAAPEDVNLTFSNLYHIDDSHFSRHEINKLFYFNLYATGLPDQTFSLHAEGHTHFNVWLDPKVPPSNQSDPDARSLAIQITGDVDAPKKDKIVLALVSDKDSNHLIADAPYGYRRFVSFDFMLDPHYEVPKGWAIHFQAWQHCNIHPPFTMEVLPDKTPMGPVNVTFGVRDDAAELLPRHPRKILDTLRLQRGEWHNFIFELGPQSDSSKQQGILSMWFDGHKRFSYTGPWGYSPTHTPLVEHECNERIALEFGIYRPLQTTTQTVYFQNMHYGKDLDSVSPFPNLERAP